MENLTRNSTDFDSGIDETKLSRIVKLSLYAAIFITSIVGNTLVCLVVCQQQRLRTSTNYYIVNLAIADLAVTLICIPFDVVVQESNYTWPFGQFLCRVIYPLMTMSTFASVGTLTAIALNRYTAVSKPMRVRASKKIAKIAIVVIWSISFIFVLPYVSVLHVSHESFCVETWSALWSKIYTVFIFVFQYVMPLGIITIAYIIIGILLRKNRLNLTAAHRRQDRDVAKVSRMMIIVVIIFAVSMLPNHILWLHGEFANSTKQAIKTQRSFLHWGAMLIYANSCTNPIVYSICIEEFRLAFRAYITKCCRVTDEDIRPVNRMFERISFRGKSFSSDRLLGRQITRRHTSGSFDSNTLMATRRGKIFRKRNSQGSPAVQEIQTHGNGEPKQEKKRQFNKIRKNKNISHKVTRV